MQCTLFDYLPDKLKNVATLSYKYGRNYVDYKDRKNKIESRQFVHSNWVITDSSHVFMHQYVQIISR
jgi:hypothetical protein